MQQDNLKFLPNIPTPVTISFDQPKTGEGQYGTYYKYGCSHQGIDKVFFAAQGLQDRLSKIGALRGRQLTITKAVEYVNGKEQTHWIIQENGQDITPNVSQTPSVTPQNAPQATYQPPVIPTQPQATDYHPAVNMEATPNYQTMSDFELKLLAEISKLLAEIRRLSDGYHELYNEIKVIRLGMPEEVQTASKIYESDDLLAQCQDKGLEPKSILDDIEEIQSSDTPF